MTHRLYVPMLEDATRYGTAPSEPIDIFALPRIDIPKAAPRTADFRAMAQDIVKWTLWSDRKLAKALGTTHPTVHALLTGTPAVGSRSREVLQRVTPTHAVIARIFVIAGRDPKRTATALESPSNGRSAVAHLRAGHPDRAYVAALDALNPPVDTGLMTGSRPSVPGEGRVDYLAES